MAKMETRRINNLVTTNFVTTQSVGTRLFHAARSMFLAAALVLTFVLASMTVAAPGAEPPRVQPKDSKAADVIEISGATAKLKVVLGQSKLLRSVTDVRRVAVVDNGIAGVAQVSPRELMVFGKAVGKTDVTFWLSGAKRKPIVVLVRVVSD